MAGLIESVATKLRDLACGCWSGSHTTLTGTEAQRKRLKIPLFATQYRPGEVILWQVDVGTTRDHQVPEQVVKGELPRGFYNILDGVLIDASMESW